MSKLVSRIEKISRGSPAPMGFGAAARASRTPAMALIGLLSSKAPNDAKVLADLDADGALLIDLDTDGDFDSLSEALASVPWGVNSEDLDAETSDALVQKGCDFFLVTPDSATVEAAKDDRAAFILSLPTDAKDGFLRALEDLPIAAAFTSLADGGPLTLQSLINVASLRTMFDKYLFVQVPPDLSSKELESLLHVGVDALVVDAGNASEDSLKTLKQRLIDLPRQRKPRSERASAVLPTGLRSGNAHPAHEDE